MRTIRYPLHSPAIDTIPLKNFQPRFNTFWLPFIDADSDVTSFTTDRGLFIKHHDFVTSCIA